MPNSQLFEHFTWSQFFWTIEGYACCSELLDHSKNDCYVPGLYAKQDSEKIHSGVLTTSGVRERMSGVYEKSRHSRYFHTKSTDEFQPFILEFLIASLPSMESLMTWFIASSHQLTNLVQKILGETALIMSILHHLWGREKKEQPRGVSHYSQPKKQSWGQVLLHLQL